MIGFQVHDDLRRLSSNGTSVITLLTGALDEDEALAR